MDDSGCLGNCIKDDIIHLDDGRLISVVKRVVQNGFAHSLSSVDHNAAKAPVYVALIVRWRNAQAYRRKAPPIATAHSRRDALCKIYRTAAILRTQHIKLATFRQIWAGPAEPGTDLNYLLNLSQGATAFIQLNDALPNFGP
jgi:hypothetical protein